MMNMWRIRRYRKILLLCIINQKATLLGGFFFEEVSVNINIIFETFQTNRFAKSWVFFFGIVT